MYQHPCALPGRPEALRGWPWPPIPLGQPGYSALSLYWQSVERVVGREPVILGPDGSVSGNGAVSASEAPGATLATCTAG